MMGPAETGVMVSPPPTGSATSQNSLVGSVSLWWDRLRQKSWSPRLLLAQQPLKTVWLGRFHYNGTGWDRSHGLPASYWLSNLSKQFGWVSFIMMGPAETEVMVSPPPTGSATSQNSLVGSVSLWWDRLRQKSWSPRLLLAQQPLKTVWLGQFHYDGTGWDRSHGLPASYWLSNLSKQFGWVGFIMMGPAETGVMVSPPPTGSATSQNSLVGSVSLWWDRLRQKSWSPRLLLAQQPLKTVWLGRFHYNGTGWDRSHGLPASYWLSNLSKQFGWVGFIMMGPAETEIMVSPPPTGSATSQNSLVGSVSLWWDRLRQESWSPRLLLAKQPLKTVWLGQFHYDGTGWDRSHGLPASYWLSNLSKQFGWVSFIIMGPAETEVMVSPPPTGSATSQNSLVGSVSL